MKNQLATVGATLLIVALLSAGSPVSPSTPIESTPTEGGAAQAAAAPGVEPQATIPWTSDLEAALEKASGCDRLVVVYITQDGCAPCRTVEKMVHPDPGYIAAAAKRCEPVKLKWETHEQEIRKLMQRPSTPTLIVMNPNGGRKRWITATAKLHIKDAIRQIEWMTEAVTR